MERRHQDSDLTKKGVGVGRAQEEVRRMIDLTKLTPKDIDRFWSKVSAKKKGLWISVGDARGCWGWKGGHKPKGYGRFTFQGHTVAAHCVNPHHLKAVCPLVNRQRRIEHYKQMIKK